MPSEGSLLEPSQLEALNRLLGPDSVLDEETQDAIRAALWVSHCALDLLKVAKATDEWLGLCGAIVHQDSLRGRIQRAIHKTEGS